MRLLIHGHLDFIAYDEHFDVDIHIHMSHIRFYGLYHTLTVTHAHTAITATGTTTTTARQ